MGHEEARGRQREAVVSRFNLPEHKVDSHLLRACKGVLSTLRVASTIATGARFLELLAVDTFMEESDSDFVVNRCDP